MSIILQNLASPTIEEAIEANFNEEFAHLSKGRPEGELHKTSELTWMFTGSHGPNAVLYSRFASNDVTYINAKINEMIMFYRTRNVDFGWSTGPSTLPTDLEQRLETHGFAYVDRTMGMAINMQDLNKHVFVNKDLVITEVNDLDRLQILRSIEISGFGASETEAQNYYDAHANTGFGDKTPWHHYIGWLHGEPVAIASLLLHAGVAGIYGVTTIPQYRRQGIAATMTLHALQEACKLGYRISILSSSKMSDALYRRIGFRDFCTIMHYGWSAGL
ncbi:MAG TPA: GNAT family N-acetyltransferase [Ktedonobacteraceae bacterium]|nr:GNAT family N-acetyltransferase [Ktedonobacteraceae bacterium]